MTDLDVTLTPAQWEHWDRHDWTLTEAPGEVWDSFLDGPTFVPVPATVPCPECNGHKVAVVTEFPRVIGPCPVCSGSGVVPRTVGITRPPSVLSYDGEVAHPIDPATAGDWYEDAVLPAERVGTATVTPVPVAAYPAPLAGEHIEADDTATWWWPDTGPYIDVTALFATPPATTVWRLDKENNR